jgi:large subunit ribosomal protein L11
LKKAANLQKGSGEPNKEKVGNVTVKDLEEIADLKMKDLNANTLESAVRMIRGTAVSMGITVSE